MKSLVFQDSNKILINLLHCSPTRNIYFSAKCERPSPSVQITYQCVFNMLSDEACTNTLIVGGSQAGVYFFPFWNTAYNDYDLIKNCNTSTKFATIFISVNYLKQFQP